MKHMRTLSAAAAVGALSVIGLSRSAAAEQSGKAAQADPPVVERPIIGSEPGRFRISQGPLSPSGLMGKAAMALFDECKYSEALTKCREALALMEKEGKDACIDVTGVNMTAGFCLVEAGEDRAALAYLVPIKQHGGATYLTEYLAIALARTGETEAAARLLTGPFLDVSLPEVCDLWKKNVVGMDASTLELRAWHYIGSCAFHSQETKAALLHFKHARSIDSHSTLVAYDLGMAYYRLEMYKDARAEFTWASKSSYPELKKIAQAELEKTNWKLQSLAARGARQGGNEPQQ